MTQSQTWELTPLGRRVRVAFGGQTLAESEAVLQIIEHTHEVRYYFPKRDVRREHLSGATSARPSARGEVVYWDVAAGGKHAARGAWNYPTVSEGRPDLRDYLAFDWHALDRMFEEEDEVSVHPRNPYIRIDAFRSSRHLKAVLNGEVLAETRRPFLVFETHLPVRYYIPREDFNWELLTPTATHTPCPYKGEASYWSATINGQVFKDFVWGYPNPFDPAAVRFKDCLAFYTEQADVYVDGKLIEKPPPMKEPEHLRVLGIE